MKLLVVVVAMLCLEKTFAKAQCTLLLAFVFFHMCPIFLSNVDCALSLVFSPMQDVTSPKNFCCSW